MARVAHAVDQVELERAEAQQLLQRNSTLDSGVRCNSNEAQRLLQRPRGQDLRNTIATYTTMYGLTTITTYTTITAET